MFNRTIQKIQYLVGGNHYFFSLLKQLPDKLAAFQPFIFSKCELFCHGLRLLLGKLTPIKKLRCWIEAIIYHGHLFPDGEECLFILVCSHWTPTASCGLWRGG